MAISKKDPSLDKKLPDNPSIFDRGNHQYPYVGGPTDGGGHWGEYHIVTHPDENADPSTAAEEHLTIHDGYHIKEKTTSGKAVEHQLNPGHHYQYIGGGHSHNKDSHSDISSGGNENRNVGLDKGSGTANNGYEGHGGTLITGTGGSGSFHNDTGGTKYVSTSGDIIKQHDGNIHTNNKGDVVSAHAGNKYDIVQKDCGIHIQGSGNYDIRVEGGKGQIYSGSDMTITSQTKITVNVGQSTFIIDGSSISAQTQTYSVKASKFQVTASDIEFTQG